MITYWVGNWTHLKKIELEHRLARQAEAAGEKIEAGPEERPYRANSAQR